ncbi:hypothetical protein ACJX0J_008035, partial [Zea mays]
RDLLHASGRSSSWQPSCLHGQIFRYSISQHLVDVYVVAANWLITITLLKSELDGKWIWQQSFSGSKILAGQQRHELVGQKCFVWITRIFMDIQLLLHKTTYYVSYSLPLL